MLPGFNLHDDTFLSEDVRQKLERESNIPVARIDGYRAGCVAFTGPLKDDDKYYKCGQLCWKQVSGITFHESAQWHEALMPETQTARRSPTSLSNSSLHFPYYEASFDAPKPRDSP